MGASIGTDRHYAFTQFLNWRRCLTSPARPFKIRVEVTGTSIQVFANGTSIGTLPDPDLTGHYTGLVAFPGTSSPMVFDNFRAGPMPYVAGTTPVTASRSTTWVTKFVVTASRATTWNVAAVPTGGGANWVDTDDFANINPGEPGHYNLREAILARTPGFTVARHPSENYGFGGMLSGRSSEAATTKDQSVKISVSNTAAPWELFVRASGTITIDQPGYFVQYNTGAAAIYWYSNGTYNGSPAVTMPSGPGTVELRCVANVCTLYINGTLLSTNDFSTSVITTDDAHQGFGMGHLYTARRSPRPAVR